MITAKIINWVMIILIGGLIFFFSAFFFLGGLEEHQALKENLLTNFAARFGFMYIIVIGSTAIIYLFNLLLQQSRPDLMDRSYPKTIGFKSLVILSLIDLIGTSVFFFA